MRRSCEPLLERGALRCDVTARLRDVGGEVEDPQRARSIDPRSGALDGGPSVVETLSLEVSAGEPRGRVVVVGEIALALREHGDRALRLARREIRVEAMRVEYRPCLLRRCSARGLLEERSPRARGRPRAGCVAALLLRLDERFEERRAIVGDGARIRIGRCALCSVGELGHVGLALAFARARQAGREQRRPRGAGRHPRRFRDRELRARGMVIPRSKEPDERFGGARALPEVLLRQHLAIAALGLRDVAA